MSVQNDANFPCKLSAAIRLMDHIKLGTARIGMLERRVGVSGRQKDFDRGVLATGFAREHDAVHIARHDEIGEHHIDRRMLIEELKSFLAAESHVRYVPKLF